METRRRFHAATLFAAGVLALASGAASHSDPAPGACGCGVATVSTSAGAWVPRPFPCDVINRLEVDYLGDDIAPPAAFDEDAADVVPALSQSAAFKVYCATDDPRFYYEVTDRFIRKTRGRRDLEVRLIGLRGKVRYDPEGNRLVFTPRNRTLGRTGALEFRFQCPGPREIYRTRFIATFRSP